MQSWLVGGPTFELLPGKDEALLVRRDAGVPSVSNLRREPECTDPSLSGKLVCQLGISSEMVLNSADLEFLT